MGTIVSYAIFSTIGSEIIIVSKSKSHRRIILEQMCAQLLLKGKSNNKKTKRN